MELYLETLLEFIYIMLVVFILGRFIYYPNRGKPDFLFTYIMLAAVVSIICIYIKRVDFGLGFALGIFAVFSIIRYRTAPIEPREMTYLFLSAGIAAKNALVPEDIEFYKMFSSDVMILLPAAIAEHFLYKNKPGTKVVVYDNLDLIHPDKREQLMVDLNNRFGITNILKIKVGKVDTIKGSARLLVELSDPKDLNYQEEV